MENNKKFLFLGVLMAVLSCSDSDNFMSTRVPVDISESSIPKSGAVNENTEIVLKAEATNECHTDIEIQLLEIKDRHYLLKATSLHSDGNCPPVMVYKDTVIVFKPVETGKYYFQTNVSPFDIRRDTLEIY